MNATLRQTSSLAVVSLVAGILGWTLLPFLGSVAAVVTGHMARSEIRRAPDRLEGDGLAIAGLVLAGVGAAGAVHADSARHAVAMQVGMARRRGILWSCGGVRKANGRGRANPSVR